MPVFDFSGASASKAEAKCTYTTIIKKYLFYTRKENNKKNC